MKPIVVDDELWLYLHADGRWHLATPWITSSGKSMPGAVETSARLRVINPETSIELRVFVRDCQGCEAIQIAGVDGIMKALTVLHTHMPITP